MICAESESLPETPTSRYGAVISSSRGMPCLHPRLLGYGSMPQMHHQQFDTCILRRPYAGHAIKQRPVLRRLHVKTTGNDAHVAHAASVEGV